MVDVFEEVEEQLRSARYQTLIKRGWPYALGAVVAAVLVTLGVWGWNQYQLDRSAKTSEAFQQAFDAMAANNGPAADAGFAKVAASGPRAYRAIALMQQAALRTSQNKPAEAIALFDQAAKVAPDQLLGDAAVLKSAYLTFDTASLAELEAKLTPIAATGRPYSALAREALAMKRLVSGQAAQARQAFALLAISPDAGEGLQARAQVALAEIDAGQAPNLAGFARAAAALTPAQIQAAKLAEAKAQTERAAAEQAANLQQQGPPGAPAAGAAPSQAGAPQ